MKKKYPKYTIEEKNKIVEEYLSKEHSRKQILRKYNISSDGVLGRWVKQYRETGFTYNKRGRTSQ